MHWEENPLDDAPRWRELRHGSVAIRSQADSAVLRVLIKVTAAPEQLQCLSVQLQEVGWAELVQLGELELLDRAAFFSPSVTLSPALIAIFGN